MGTGSPPPAELSTRTRALAAISAGTPTSVAEFQPGGVLDGRSIAPGSSATSTPRAVLAEAAAAGLLTCWVAWI
jgi:hypothetical protein